MTRILAVAATVLVSATSVACFHPQNDLRGQCSSDTDCGAGARCDKTVSPPVCVASTCSPACDSSSVCDTQTVTCKPVTTPSIVVTTPAANAFVGGKVQVTATARAPGSAQGVTFQVKNGAGTVIGTGTGTAPPGSADFSATLTLSPSGLTDGPATVSATLTYPGGTLPSETVPVTIDVTPPVVTSLQVFLAGADVPATQGVTYPGQPSGVTPDFQSGHDGTHFILNDHVHLKGAVIDNGAGLSCATLQYRIDGANGARGSAQPLPGCTADGSKSVTFDIPVLSLNDPKNGSLGTGTGNLHLVVVAADTTAGTPNMLPEAPQSIAVTRVWWSRQFTPATITGIAIHPDGDVIVTSNAAIDDSVFALFRDGPFHSDTGGVRWSFRAGTVSGGPAIGTDAAGQPIYVGGVVSATVRNIFSLKPHEPPTVIWSAPVNAAPSDAPAVAPGAVQVGGVSNCEAVVAGGGSLVLAACQVPGSQGGSNAAVRIGSANPGAIEAIGDAPITIAGGAIYASTDKSIARTVLLSDGTLDTPVRFANTSGGNYTGVLPVGGARFLSGSGRDNSIYGVSFNGTGFDSDFTTNVSASIQGMPIFNSASAVSFVTGDSKLHSMTTSGADTVTAPVTTPGATPLLGHDGISYVGRNGAITAIMPTGNVGWEVALPAKVTVAPTIDCSGALYVAAFDTVYAIVTEMMSDPDNAGLADTPWPKFQRDSRNTGNADIPIRYGVRTAPGPGGCTQ